MYSFQDRVKIIKGFYKGLEGRLINVNSDFDDPNCYKYYDVEILRQISKALPIISKTVTVPEEYLEKI